MIEKEFSGQFDTITNIQWLTDISPTISFHTKITRNYHLKIYNYIQKTITLFEKYKNKLN
jgi:hypothetical protein